MKDEYLQYYSATLHELRHRTCLAIADYSTATEWNTALRNKAFANGDAGSGSYTTVTGDRLVVEIGHNDSAGSSISGSSRWGSAGTADLGENETSTSTTERPWFETSVNITFDTSVAVAAVVSGIGTAAAALTVISPVVSLAAVVAGIGTAAGAIAVTRSFQALSSGVGATNGAMSVARSLSVLAAGSATGSAANVGG